MSNQPLLSVLIPTFDGERFIRRALDSLLQEVGREGTDEIEVLMIDDRSLDGTVAAAEAYVDRLPLTIIRREGPRNWAAGTNEGLSAARGSFSCFLHQDDTWLPGRIYSLRRFLEKLPELDWLLGAARLIDDSDRQVGVWRPPLPAERLLEPGVVFERLLIQNFIPIPAPVFRTETALALGGLNEALWYTADWEFWLRWAASRARAALDPDPKVAFRIHSASQTMSRSVAPQDLRNQLEQALKLHVKGARQSATVRAARFSVEVNVALAALANRARIEWSRLLATGLRLGPRGVWRFSQSARILQRVAPRLRLLG